MAGLDPRRIQSASESCRDARSMPGSSRGHERVSARLASWPPKSQPPPCSPALTAAPSKTSCCGTTPASSPRSSPATAPPPAPRTFVIPAFVNAHDHARPTASSFGAVDMPLESWILRSAFGTPPDPYLAAASAMARSARSGCGAMMIHYTRPSGKHAAGRGSQGDRPRRQRCRHPHRLCARGARPEPGRLRRQRAGAVRPLRRGPQQPSRNCSSSPRCRRATTSS